MATPTFSAWSLSWFGTPPKKRNHLQETRAARVATVTPRSVGVVTVSVLGVIDVGSFVHSRTTPGVKTPLASHVSLWCDALRAAPSLVHTPPGSSNDVAFRSDQCHTTPGYPPAPTLPSTYVQYLCSEFEIQTMFRHRRVVHLQIVR